MCQANDVLPIRSELSSMRKKLRVLSRGGLRLSKRPKHKPTSRMPRVSQAPASSPVPGLPLQPGRTPVPVPPLPVQGLPQQQGDQSPQALPAQEAEAPAPGLHAGEGEPQVQARRVIPGVALERLPALRAGAPAPSAPGSSTTSSSRGSPRSRSGSAPTCRPGPWPALEGGETAQSVPEEDHIPKHEPQRGASLLDFVAGAAAFELQPRSVEAPTG